MRFGALRASSKLARLSRVATVVWIRTDDQSHRNVFFGMVGPILHALHSRPRMASEVTDLALRTGRSIFGPRWEGAGCLRQSPSPLAWSPRVDDFTLHTRITTDEPKHHVEALLLSVDGLDLLDHVPYSGLVEAVHAGLPQGSEVTAVYRDEKDPRSARCPSRCAFIASVAFCTSFAMRS